MASSQWLTPTIKPTNPDLLLWALPRRCKTRSTAWSAQTVVILSGKLTIGRVHTTLQGRCQVNQNHRWTMVQSVLNLNIGKVQRRATGGINSNSSSMHSIITTIDQLKGKSLIKLWTAYSPLTHPNALVVIGIEATAIDYSWETCHNWISSYESP